MKNEGNYKIALTREAAVPQKAIVGEVLPEKKAFKCEILLDDALVAKYEMGEVFATLLPFSPPRTPEYKIIISADFLKKLQRQDANAFFKLYREIGHIHHRDLLPKEHGEETPAPKNGEPAEADLAADRFAMSYMGFALAVDGLKAIKKEREQLYEAAACSETKEQRKMAVEEIEKRLLILCEEACGE